MSKKKERKPLELPFVIRFIDKTIKTITFNFIPKVGSRFHIDKDEFKVKGFDGPLVCVVKIKQLSDKEVAEKKLKRYTEAYQHFWGKEPIITLEGDDPVGMVYEPEEAVKPEDG